MLHSEEWTARNDQQTEAVLKEVPGLKKTWIIACDGNMSPQDVDKR